MDIVVLARMCLRRWYVVLVVFALIAGYGIYQYTSAKPTYTAQAQLIVVAAGRTDVAQSPGASPTSGTSASATATNGTTTGDADASGAPTSPKPTAPSSSSTSGASNPLQNVQTTIVALVARMQADRSVVQSGGGTATFVVGQLNKGGPLLAVTASGTGRAAVMSALQAGIPAVAASLTTLQDDVGAPTDSRFRAVTLQTDPSPSAAYPSRTKGLIVTLVIGLLVAILLAVIVDAVVARTQRRRSATTVPPGSSP